MVKYAWQQHKLPGGEIELLDEIRSMITVVSDADEVAQGVDALLEDMKDAGVDLKAPGLADRVASPGSPVGWNVVRSPHVTEERISSDTVPSGIGDSFQTLLRTVEPLRAMR